jgi:cobalamin biosynthesis Mg chelatase CobN
MLALLALFAFPVFAHAAGIPEYLVPKEETGIERHPVSQPKPHEGNPQGSETPQPAQGSASDVGNSSEESTEQSQASPGAANGNGNSGNGPSPGKSPQGGGKPAAPPAGAVGPSEVHSVAAAHRVPTGSRNEDGSGGSSPVLPILIAVIILAALSIGVAIYRQRRPGVDLDGGAKQPIRSTPQA